MAPRRTALCRPTTALEELIERCAPFMAESCHITRDEAVSFMGALLPTLKRW